MKKQFLLIYFLTGFFISGYSQVRFTPNVGLNFASVRFTNGNGEMILDQNNIPTFSTKKGFKAGMDIEIPLSDILIIAPGIYYQDIGFIAKSYLSQKVNGVSVKGSFIDVASMKYIQLPLNFGFSLPAGQNLKINIVAGPYLALFIGGNEEVKLTVTSGSSTSSNKISALMKPGKHTNNPYDETVYVNPYDFGITGGLNFVVRDGLNIGINYQYGISNIRPFLESKPVNYSRKDESKLKNTVLSFRLGYTFFKKKK
jgi:hypothetical protein